MKLKLLTIVGTRPEIIRLSCLIKKLNIFFNHKIVNTNQNFDPKLNSNFF
jgi:UDP-N-acetylglucosamine 2-epimerase (non-hydrolysing)